MSEDNSTGIPLGAKIGIGVGVAVAITIVIAAVITLFCLRRRNKTSAASPHDALAELHVEVAEPKMYQLSGKPVAPGLDPTTSPGAAARLSEIEGASPVEAGLQSHKIVDSYSFGGSRVSSAQVQLDGLGVGRRGWQGPDAGTYVGARSVTVAGGG